MALIPRKEIQPSTLNWSLDLHRAGVDFHFDSWLWFWFLVGAGISGSDFNHQLLRSHNAQYLSIPHPPHIVYATLIYSGEWTEVAAGHWFLRNVTHCPNQVERGGGGAHPILSLKSKWKGENSESRVDWGTFHVFLRAFWRLYTVGSPNFTRASRAVN